MFSTASAGARTFLWILIPRIDLTKPIWEQVQRLAAQDVSPA
jgi:hypothetical protein